MWLENLRQIKQDSGMKTAEIAERAKSRPKSKGRSVSDAGPEDKRFTVENGVVRY